MIVSGWVCFFLGVSVFLLTMAAIFGRGAIGSAMGCVDNQKNLGERRGVGMGERMRSSLLLRRRARVASVIAALVLLGKGAAFAAPVEAAGGEANLKLPDLTQVQFLGMDGHSLLMYGPLFCILGMIFGFVMYVHLKGLPVHRSMGKFRS